ncbi:hypothetical protein GGR52DRAFT_588688 [Hypoxylon sp. FL1284]|nr:hypothetical protein GGR52DRAFT_588688 [Hypoxylon sp. FL1284]
MYSLLLFSLVLSLLLVAFDSFSGFKYPSLEASAVAIPTFSYLHHVRPALGFAFLGLSLLVGLVVLGIARQVDVSAWYVAPYLITHGLLWGFTSYGWYVFWGAFFIKGYIDQSLVPVLRLFGWIPVLSWASNRFLEPGAFASGLGYCHGQEIWSSVVSDLRQLNWNIEVNPLVHLTLLWCQWTLATARTTFHLVRDIINGKYPPPYVPTGAHGLERLSKVQQFSRSVHQGRWEQFPEEVPADGACPGFVGGNGHEYYEELRKAERAEAAAQEQRRQYERWRQEQERQRQEQERLREESQRLWREEMARQKARRQEKAERSRLQHNQAHPSRSRSSPDAVLAQKCRESLRSRFSPAEPASPSPANPSPADVAPPPKPVDTPASAPQPAPEPELQPIPEPAPEFAPEPAPEFAPTAAQVAYFPQSLASAAPEQGPEQFQAPVHIQELALKPRHHAARPRNSASPYGLRKQARRQARTMRRKAIRWQRVMAEPRPEPEPMGGIVYHNANPVMHGVPDAAEEGGALPWDGAEPVPAQHQVLEVSMRVDSQITQATEQLQEQKRVLEVSMQVDNPITQATEPLQQQQQQQQEEQQEHQEEEVHWDDNDDSLMDGSPYNKKYVDKLHPESSPFGGSFFGGPTQGEQDFRPSPAPLGSSSLRLSSSPFGGSPFGGSVFGSSPPQQAQQNEPGFRSSPAATQFASSPLASSPVRFGVPAYDQSQQAGSEFRPSPAQSGSSSLRFGSSPYGSPSGGVSPFGMLQQVERPSGPSPAMSGTHPQPEVVESDDERPLLRNPDGTLIRDRQGRPIRGHPLTITQNAGSRRAPPPPPPPEDDGYLREPSGKLILDRNQQPIRTHPMTINLNAGVSRPRPTSRLGPSTPHTTRSRSNVAGRDLPGLQPVQSRPPPQPVQPRLPLALRSTNAADEEDELDARVEWHMRRGVDEDNARIIAMEELGW